MIEARELTRAYGHTRAVDGLSFTVAPGDIVGFLGPNGAGKTTTMRMLVGALAATSGSARVAGIDVAKDPRGVRSVVGYLPEVPPLYTDMTVRDYLRFAGRLRQVKDPRAEAERVLERVGLGPVGGRLIGHLSKGYRQRVGIAQALVHRPKLLLLDEPVSGLDPAQRVEIRTLIQELAAGDTTIVLSTHVLPEIEALCSRVLILFQGRLVAEDSMQALTARKQGARLRVAAPEGLAEALSALPTVTEVRLLPDGAFEVRSSDDCRAAVAAVAVPFGLLELSASGRLEDVYLQLTQTTPGGAA